MSDAQKNALEKYDEVANQLAISKEFAKQLQAIVSQSSKDAKRDARKAQFLRQINEQTKVREVIVMQDILKQLKSETIRNDFLQGSNSACLIEPDEMNLLEQFSKHTTPVHPSFSNEPSFFNSAKSAADHLHYATDGRNRQFLESGFTYEKIKELFSRIENCGYWAKNIKFVEVPSSSPTSMTQERPAESETPQSSDDLESKEDKVEMAEMKMTSAPLPAQVPNPTQLFNGANPMMAHHHHAVPMQHPSGPVSQQQQQQIPMKPVTAVENAFYNQMKYSQHQQQGPAGMNNNNVYIQDFSSSNFSFLQDSEVLEQQKQQAVHVAANSQAQQPKIPSNYVSQPKHSPVQANAVQPNLNSFHQPAQTHHYPPGLKLQQNNNNIPVNYSQASQTQHSNVPTHLIQQVKFNFSIYFNSLLI